MHAFNFYTVIHTFTWLIVIMILVQHLTLSLLMTTVKMSSFLVLKMSLFMPLNKDPTDTWKNQTYRYKVPILIYSYC